MPDVWSYWYFHVPNFVLAALVYTLLGRFVLGFFVPADWDNYIWRAFTRFTDPVLLAVGYVTPAVVPHRVIVLFAVLWLTLARVALALTLAGIGLLPVGSAT